MGDQLGLHALRITGATLVICFGGGPDVETECAGAPRAVKWLIFPATRPKKDHEGEMEECALTAIADGRVTFGACCVHGVPNCAACSQPAPLSAVVSASERTSRRRAASAAWAGEHSKYYYSALMS